jgi:hypothetical protein
MKGFSPAHGAGDGDGRDAQCGGVAIDKFSACWLNDLAYQPPAAKGSKMKDRTNHGTGVLKRF